MSDELKKCKHCGHKLDSHNVKAQSKKKLEERPGIWGGIEFPYIQIYRIICPNSLVCGKSYSAKVKGSDWLYK